MRIHLLHTTSYGKFHTTELDAFVTVSQNISGVTHGVTVAEAQRNDNCVVIPRFRMIPFGQELQQEVNQHAGIQLLNTYEQHRNIADISRWVNLLRAESNDKLTDNLTAAIHTVDEIPSLPDGEYFVKGETNSKKNDWANSAYANSIWRLPVVVRNLMQDHYIGEQQIYIRPFQKFEQIGEAVDNRPVFNERRVFILDGEIMSEGYYWSSFPELQELSDNSVKNTNGDYDVEYMRALGDAINATKHLARFYVIDMAQVDAAELAKRQHSNPDAYMWQVVELNDGCMSGLSENDPIELWENVLSKLKASD